MFLRRSPRAIAFNGCNFVKVRACISPLKVRRTAPKALDFQRGSAIIMARGTRPPFQDGQPTQVYVTLEQSNRHRAGWRLRRFRTITTEMVYPHRWKVHVKRMGSHPLSGDVTDRQPLLPNVSYHIPTASARIIFHFFGKTNSLPLIRKCAETAPKALDFQRGFSYTMYTRGA